jgi:hypothetical protein
VDAEVKKLRLTRSQVTSNSNEYYENLHVHYPDNTESVIPNTVSLKKSTGTSEMSGMTQKAITDAIGTATTNMTSYVNNAVSNVTINLGSQNAGHLVTVNSNGGLTSSSLTEDDLINGVTPVTPIIPSGDNEVVGLDINYTTSTYTRTYDAIGKIFGTSFDIYTMYGGRVRCNVSDNGEITAFYGDNNYRDDGSNGQVMIYQPKFYYKRTPQSLTGFAIN